MVPIIDRLSTSPAVAFYIVALSLSWLRDGTLPASGEGKGFLRGNTLSFTALFLASLTADSEQLTAFHVKPRRFSLYFVDISEFLQNVDFFA